MRPYQSAVKSSVEIDGGPNDLTPLIVVLLLPARSAEPPHSSGSFGADVVEHLAERGAGGHRLGAGLPVGQVGVPAFGQLLGQQPVQQLLALGFALGPRVELRLPLLVGLLAAVHQLAGVLDDLVAHLERLVRVEAEHLLGGGDLVVAQRRAVHAAGVHLGGRRVADDGAHAR